MPDTVLVEYYGVLRGVTSREDEFLSLEMPSTVQDILDRLTDLHPDLKKHLDSCAVAIDNTVVNSSFAVGPGTTMALLPPVGGG